MEQSFGQLSQCLPVHIGRGQFHTSIPSLSRDLPKNTHLRDIPLCIPVRSSQRDVVSRCRRTRSSHRTFSLTHRGQRISRRSCLSATVEWSPQRTCCSASSSWIPRRGAYPPWIGSVKSLHARRTPRGDVLAVLTEAAPFGSDEVEVAPVERFPIPTARTHAFLTRKFRPSATGSTLARSRSAPVFLKELRELVTVPARWLGAIELLRPPPGLEASHPVCDQRTTATLRSSCENWGRVAPRPSTGIY